VLRKIIGFVAFEIGKLYICIFKVQKNYLNELNFMIKNLIFSLVSFFYFSISLVGQTTCSVELDKSPLERATGFEEFNIKSGLFSGIAQQFNDISGSVSSVKFWARVNPASAASNDVRVRLYSYNPSQQLPHQIKGEVILTINASAESYEVTANFSTPIQINSTDFPENKIILAIEPYSPTVDDFFIRTNKNSDGLMLQRLKLKQGSLWFKDMGYEGYDFDALILPIGSITVNSNFTSTSSSLTASFTNTSNGAGSNPIYSWDFGDGSAVSSEVSPSHTYAQGGTYTVSLTTTHSGSGCSDLRSKQVTVALDPCAGVSISANFSSQVNVATVTFNNTSTGASTYKWSFGDGNTSTNLNPTHTYAANGTYTVKLEAFHTDPACVKSIEKQIAITTVGVAEHFKTQNIQMLSANPVKSSILIESDKFYKFMIVNTIGQKVSEGNLNLGLNTFSIEYLAPGVYYFTGENIKPIKFFKL
jgi:hypothetical protein